MRLFELMYEYKTAPGNGAVKGTTREVITDTAKLRFDYKINLAPEWEVALRADLPLRAKDPLNSSNPSGDYAYGVGDVDVQAADSPDQLAMGRQFRSPPLRADRRRRHRFGQMEDHADSRRAL